MKICIAVPTAGFIDPDVFVSIYSLDRCGHECLFGYSRGYGCADSRNKIIKEALSENADYILMVDSDTVIPPDTLERMLECPVDVCLGSYYHKPSGINGNRLVLFKQFMPSGEPYANYPIDSMYTDDELSELFSIGVSKIKVHGGGFGCALINTSILHGMEYPYFNYVEYADGNELSEDLYFCEQCRRHGIDIYADIRVKCGHVMKYVK